MELSSSSEESDDEITEVFLAESRSPPNVLDHSDGFIFSGARRSETDQEDSNFLDSGIDAKVIAFVLKTFPDVQSLSNIEPYLRKLHMKMERMTKEMLVGVSSVHLAQAELTEANRLIQSLGGLFFTLKERCEETEETTKDFLLDLKPLSCAKKNLQLEITILRQIRFLTQASALLKQLTENRQYVFAACYLEACNQVFISLGELREVSKVSMVIRDIEELKSGLKQQIFQQFNAYCERQGIPENEEITQLVEAFAVIDALGPEARKELVTFFTKNFLRTYSMGEFQAGGKYASLEHAEKRYAWMRDRLYDYDQLFGPIFPPHWGVIEAICTEFCMITRNNIQALLEQRADQPDDGICLFVLQKTVEFEQELSEKFRVLVQNHLANRNATLGEYYLRTAETDDDRHYENVVDIGLEQIATKFGLPIQLKGAPSLPPTPKFVGMISSCFEAYMAVSPNRVSSMFSQSKTGEMSGSSSFAETTLLGSKRRVAAARLDILLAQFRTLEEAQRNAIPSEHSLTEEHLVIGSYEALLLCTELMGLDLDSDRLCAPFQNQMNISPKKHQALAARLKVRPLSPDTNRRVPSLNAVRPHLHYRFMLLKSRRPVEFDRKADFKSWQDRQIAIFFSGILWAIKSSKLTTFKIRKTETSFQDIKIKLSGLFQQLKDVAAKSSGVQFNEDAYAVVLRDLDSFLQHLYKAYDKASNTSAASRYVLPIAYPVNMQLYEQLLRSCYSREEDPCAPPSEPSIIEALQHVRSHFGISQLMHEICVAVCMWRHSIRQSSKSRLYECFTALKKQCEKLRRKGESDMEKLYLIAAMALLREYLLHRLSDAHKTYTFEDTNLISLEYELYMMTKHMMDDRFDAKADDDADEDDRAELSMLLISSVSRNYDRLVQAFKKPMDIADLIQLCDSLKDHVEIEAEVYACSFGSSTASADNAARTATVQIALEEICKLLAVDANRTLSQRHSLDALAIRVLSALKALQVHVGEVGGFTPQKQVTLLETSRLYAPLVSEWLQLQHVAFYQCLERCVQMDKWLPVDDKHKLSHSVIDLFAMFAQTLPLIFDLAIPLPADCIHTLALSIDGIMQKYAMAVVRSCGPRSALMPPEVASSKLASIAQSIATKTGRLASRTDILPRLANTSELLKMVGKKTAEVSSGNQSLEEVCVKLNNLLFGKESLVKLEDDVRKKWTALHTNITPQPLDERLFDGALLSLESCCDELIKFIATKIIYVDLKAVFMESLYNPSPREDPLGVEPVLDTLSPLLSIIREFITDELTQALTLHAILRTFADCYQRILLDSANRTFTIDDFDKVSEDLKNIEEFWISRDTHGVVHGLDESDVKSRLAFISRVVNSLFPLPTSQLITQYGTSPEVSTYAQDPHTKRTILKVIAHRGDPESKAFLKHLAKKSPAT